MRVALNNLATDKPVALGIPWSNWKSEVLVSVAGGKPENPEKNTQCKERTNNKLYPYMTPGLRIKLGPHWWEASTLTIAPSLLPHPYLSTDKIIY